MIGDVEENVARCDFFDSVYRDIIVKYPFNITCKSSKIVLFHKRIRLEQVVDHAYDREKYKNIMYNYADYCKVKHGAKIDTKNLNIDTMFNSECLHDLSNKYPMFFGFNHRNELVGIFGFRKSINLNIGSNGIVNLQEISIRTNCKNNTGLAIYGGIAFFMLYAYAMKNNANIFMSTLRFLRSTMFHVSDVCKFSFIQTCTRYVDVLNSNIVLDLWTTHKDVHVHSLLVKS